MTYIHEIKYCQHLYVLIKENDSCHLNIHVRSIRHFDITIPIPNLIYLVINKWPGNCYFIIKCEFPKSGINTLLHFRTLLIGLHFTKKSYLDVMIYRIILLFKYIIPSNSFESQAIYPFWKVTKHTFLSL